MDPPFRERLGVWTSLEAGTTVPRSRAAKARAGFWLGMAGAVVFAIVFGLSQGLSSIVRGTIPLVLFGRIGYGARLGKISAISVAVKSCAPFVFALLIENTGPAVAFGSAGVLAVVSLLVLRFVPRPA